MKDVRYIEETDKYVKHLHHMVALCKNKTKKELTEEEKLARVLYFNLTKGRKFGLESLYSYTVLVLETFTHFEPNTADLVLHEKLVFEKIPRKVKSQIYQDYELYQVALEVALEQGVYAAEEEGQEQEALIGKGALETAKESGGGVYAVGSSLPEDEEYDDYDYDDYDDYDDEDLTEPEYMTDESGFKITFIE